MSIAQRQHLFSLALWLLVGALFVFYVVRAGGPHGFTRASQSQHAVEGIVWMAAFCVGLLGSLWLRHRAQKGGESLDERDERIFGQAAFYTALLLSGAFFLVCFFLADNFDETGSIPVGWLWMLAYASLISIHLVFSTVFLVLDRLMLGHGEG